jgi:hypothetical protein
MWYNFSGDLYHNYKHMDETVIATTPKKKCALFGSRTFELSLLLVFGILLGFALKTEASKRITLGANDYLLVQNKNGGVYDLDAVQKEIITKGSDSGTASSLQQAGGSCGQ